MFLKSATYLVRVLLVAVYALTAAPVLFGELDFVQIAAFASDNSGPGGGGGGSGSGGGSSGPGGGGDGGSNSGPGGGGDNSGPGSGDSGASSGRNQNRGTSTLTDSNNVKRYLDALKRHGTIRSVQTSPTSISVTYSDGWRESVNGSRYQLFDQHGRRVVERAARQSDLTRLQAAPH